LEGDGIGVRRAVPAVAIGGREGIRIAAGEGILGLSQRADVDGFYRARVAGQLLRHSQRRDDLALLRAPGLENSADMKFRAAEAQGVSYPGSQIAGQLGP